MGIPRLSAKKCFIYMTCATCMILLVMNVHQKGFWHSLELEPEQPQLSHVNSELKKVLNSSKTTGLINNSVVKILDLSQKPWFMKGGLRQPLPAPKVETKERRQNHLWPDDDSDDDRIMNQLMYMPSGYNKTFAEHHPKKIMIPHGMDEAKTGSDLFIQQSCPISTCVITRDDPENADLILFKDYVTHVGHRPPNQVWALYFLESPYHTQPIENAIVNWTATYRRDSDIVAPYEKWQYYDSNKVAWFVSNCHARNERMSYARELSKYIQVDIYGACGNLHCSKTHKCFQMLDNDYKFYLAFENSNCQDYITEKFFVNGLGHNVLPIVMGARQEDYEKSAPYKSYIHVDEFTSAKELATWLHHLDQDDDLYNSYFKWKGTGEFINTYFWCRLCAMIHDHYPSKYYNDINEWWRGDNICTLKSWREKSKRIT
ncbi:hypothetical protein HCN44_000808 [Aphidius gifuensis]|uniref:Fucosyltransferase n=1 Tax=Aphidius gifuensis TaxID=684658 RepID=A0A834XPE8_APHGI|nr:hypothetical protein HCN44_000808 [Aphidius gifuensis]